MKINTANLNVSLRHIRAIHAIWVQGSFVRAAADLGVVPSALTETIRQLEEAVGAPLFDRSQRPPAPSALALSFLRETASLLDGMDQAVFRLRSGAGQGAGRLAIGCTPSAIGPLVAPAIKGFRARHPKVRIRVQDEIAEVLARQVSAGELDLAVAGRALHSADLKQSEIKRDRFGLVCAAGHGLAGRETVVLAEIDPGEVIALDRATGTQALLAGHAALPPALRQGALEAYSTIAQMAMIRAGLGVALLPQDAVSLFGDPGLRFVPIADLELWRSLYLLTPARGRLSAIAREFIDTLKGVPQAEG
jgi:DNA-binding transcriptional LysR family regulator